MVLFSLPLPYVQLCKVGAGPGGSNQGSVSVCV